MNRNEILEAVFSQIKAITDIGFQEMNEDSAVIDDLEMDSLEIMMMISKLEQSFGIRFHPKELRSIITVGELTDCIKDKLLHDNYCP